MHKMKIRDDIFPQAQDIAQGLTHVTFQSFDSLFSSKNDIIRYINNFEDPEHARQFLEVGEFYHFVKFYYCPICFPPKRIETCPKCNKTFELPAYIVLIMIVSISERLSLGLKKFTDFFSWVGRKETLREYQALLESGEIKEYEGLIHTLKNHWSQEYGSTTKVTEFFNKFLTKEEKIEFVKSIRYFRKVPELPPIKMGKIEGKTREDVSRIFEQWRKAMEEEKQPSFNTDEDVKNYVKSGNFKMTWEALPICFYNEHYWKCYSRDLYGRGLGYCHYNLYCPLIHDEEMIKECLKKTVETIYDWRSKFVHGERLPPISEVAIHGDVYKKKSVIVQLTTTKLKTVFERMLKRYFDEFQKKE